MRIYLAWSGERGSALAKEFNDWLPRVIQALKPFYSPSDIEKGTRWASELASVLQSCEVGIIFLTPESKDKPWLLFEAGALSKVVASSRVVPMLFDFKGEDLEYPLAQFQASSFDQEAITQLMVNINQMLGESQVDGQVLMDAIENYWPKLQSSVETILKKGNPHKASARNAEHIQDEILTLSRLNAEGVQKLLASLIQPKPATLPFNEGDSVIHGGYGEGIVLAIQEVASGDHHVKVQFRPPVGVKTLSQKIGKLRPIVKASNIKVLDVSALD